MTKEPGLPLAASYEGLQEDEDQDTKNRKRKIKARSRMKQYPPERNNDVMHCTRGMVSGLEHEHDPYVEALPLHALYSVVQGKKH